MFKPKVSVAICTYNGEKFIKEQLESILQQTVTPDEIIICDDVSNDNTFRIVNQIKQETKVLIRIARNEENLGYIKNFEKSMTLCTGDIIFLSDQDDVWVENKIETVLNAFNSVSNIDIVFSDAKLVDAELNSLAMTMWESINFNKDKLALFRENHLSILLKSSVVTGATMAIKKVAFEKCLPFSNNWVHDEWLNITTALNEGKIVGIKEQLIKYRQHTSNQIGTTIRGNVVKESYKSAKKSRNIDKEILKTKDLIDYGKRSGINSEYIFWLEKRLDILVGRTNLSKLKIFRIPVVAFNLLFSRKYNYKNYREYFNGYKTILSDLFRN